MSSFTSNVADVDADTYFAAIVAGGDSISTASRAAVTRLVKRLKATTVWPCIHRCAPYVGTGLGAALQPLKALFGNATDTNNGPFVSGDFNEATTGLRVASGNTKFLQTGYIPNTAGISNSNMHASAFLLDDIDTADANSSPFFATTTSPTSEFGLGTAMSIGYNGKNTAPYIGPGMFSFSCRTDGVQTVNGYQICRYMPGAAAVSLGGANEVLVFGGLKTSGGNRIGWGAIGWYSIGTTLTDQQQRDLTSAVESFQVEMGRTSKKPLCVIFGDSITRGFGMTAASQRFSRQVANARGEREMCFGIDNCRTNLDFTAGNPYALAGINRYTDIINNLIVKPQTVAIQLGVNDLYDDPAASGTQATADLYSTNLQTIIQYCLDHGILAANIYVGSPSYGTDSHFGNATKQQMYATAASTAAAAKGVKYVAIWEVTSTSASYTLQGDGIHPTSGGQTVMANTYIAAG